jgi:hypothetical protein
VTIRPNIQMYADFPDDMIEDDHDIVQFAGRNIAEALREAFGERGYRVSEPIEAGEHGWELDVYKGKRRFWVQITSMSEDGEVLLMTQNMASWFRPDLPTFRLFLSDLEGVLEEDPRFNRIGWLTKDWWRTDAPPSGGPFDD